MSPHPLEDGEVLFIKQTVQRFNGANVVARNFGPDSKILEICVEADFDAGTTRDECLGGLRCRLVRDRIDLTVTRRGSRIQGKARVAYRQGVII